MAKEKKHLMTIVSMPSQLGLENILISSMQRGKTPHPNQCPVHDIKQTDGEAPVILEFGEYSYIAIDPKSPLTRSSSNG